VPENDHQRARPAERVHGNADPIDGREQAAHERVESGRHTEGGAGKPDGTPAGAGTGGRGNDRGDQREGTRHRMLRVVPEPARDAVNPKTFELPRRDGIDVGVGQLGVGTTLFPQLVHGEGSFGARGQHCQSNGCGGGSGPRHGGAREQVEHRDQQATAKYGVRFEHALNIAAHGGHCRHQKIGPVIVHGP
jgi:hypothetical protein